MRRRAALVGLVVAALLGGTPAHAAADDRGRSGTHRVQVVHFYRYGPGSECESDACGVGSPQPLTISFPAAHHSYSGTIALSFRYRTRGKATFCYGADLVTHIGGRHFPLDPEHRKLAAARHATHASGVFRFSGVPAGKDIQLWLFAQIRDRDVARTAVSLSRVHLELDAAPAHR